jgi:hypothetical protein
VILTGIQFVSAQVFTEITLTNMYDDNVNNSVDRLESNILRMDLSGGYSIEGERNGLDLSYNGSFSYYQSVLSRTNQFHSADLLYTNLSGDDDENRFRLGASYGAGVNRDLNSIFDHSLLSASADYKYFLSERFIHTVAYSFRSVQFPSLTDFSYSEHALMTNGAVAVTGTTTAILQLDLGTKFYATGMSGSSSSMRKGVMSSILPSVTQLTGMMKVGQGITDQIGISLSARYQWNIQKQTRYLSSDYGYISDDELFDDHYGYQGLHTAVQYTQLISETLTGKITGGIQNREYSSLAAYDMQGNLTSSQRNDVRSYLNFLVKKDIPSLGVTVKTSVDLIDNTSNDAYYDYKNTAVSVELSLPF